MKNGKLNKRDIETLLKAQDILNAWIDYHMDNQDIDELIPENNEYAISLAMNAAGGINNLYWFLADED